MEKKTITLKRNLTIPSGVVLNRKYGYWSSDDGSIRLRDFCEQCYHAFKSVPGRGGGTLMFCKCNMLPIRIISGRTYWALVFFSWMAIMGISLGYLISRVI